MCGEESCPTGAIVVGFKQLACRNWQVDRHHLRDTGLGAARSYGLDVQYRSGRGSKQAMVVLLRLKIAQPYLSGIAYQPLRAAKTFRPLLLGLFRFREIKPPTYTTRVSM